MQIDCHAAVTRLGMAFGGVECPPDGASSVSVRLRHCPDHRGIAPAVAPERCARVVFVSMATGAGGRVEVLDARGQRGPRRRSRVRVCAGVRSIRKRCERNVDPLEQRSSNERAIQGARPQSRDIASQRSPHWRERFQRSRRLGERVRVSDLQRRPAKQARRVTYFRRIRRQSTNRRRGVTTH